MKHNQQAFTLIELLVVVLIIGILAAVAVPQYQKAVWKARYVQAKTMAQNIARAEEVYFLANGQYSPSLEELDIELPATSFTFNGKLANFSWGQCELYVLPGDNEIACRINKNGANYLAYQLGFEHSRVLPNQAVCLAYTKNAGDINYQVCQNETGKKVGQSWGATSTGFTYP